MKPVNAAVVGTTDYHTTMQHAAKHALLRQGGYVPHTTGDTLSGVSYPFLDIRLQYLHQMVCAMQFEVAHQEYMAGNPRITYLLLLESLLTVKSDTFEKALQYARMRLIALLVDVCVTGCLDEGLLSELVGYFSHLTSKTPTAPNYLLGRPLISGKQTDYFAGYCLAIVETLNDAMQKYELVSYRIQFLKFWRDLTSRLIINRGWLHVETSMQWLRQYVITRLESDKP